MKKKLGVGSISLLLSIISIIWSFNIFGYCLGDNVLEALNITTWSNGTTGIHYTNFYAFIFLIPSVIIGIKKNKDLFATVGKWCSIVFSVILFLVSILFIIF